MSALAGRRQEPGVAGLLTAHGSSISPRKLCMDYQRRSDPHAGTPFIARTRPTTRAARHLGAFMPGCGRREEVWQTTERYPSGAAPSSPRAASFLRNARRLFKAADARTGEVLWRFKVGSGVVEPITYTGSDGKQYVPCTRASAATGSLAGTSVDDPADVRPPADHAGHRRHTAREASYGSSPLVLLWASARHAGT